MMKKVVLLVLSVSILLSGCSKPYSSKGPSGDGWLTYNAGYNARVVSVQQQQNNNGTTRTTTSAESSNKIFSGSHVESEEIAECQNRTIETCRQFAKKRSNQP